MQMTKELVKKRKEESETTYNSTGSTRNKKSSGKCGKPQRYKKQYPLH
jgi:hypothetical protein